MATARRAAALMLASGLSVGLLLVPSWWGWWLFWSVAGPGYSLVAKGRGWLAPGWTALVIASCYLPGAAADGLQITDAFVFLMVVHFLFLREYVKALEDGRGDGAAGYRTLAGSRWDNRHGLALLASPLLVASILLTVTGTAGHWGLAAGVAFVSFLVAALWILPASRRAGRHLAGAFLKAGAFCGLVHIYAWPVNKFI